MWQKFALKLPARSNHIRFPGDQRKEVISIFADGQAALKAVTNPIVTSTLVWNSREELRVLAEKNRLNH